MHGNIFIFRTGAIHRRSSSSCTADSIMELKWSVSEYRDKLLHRLGDLVAMNLTKALRIVLDQLKCGLRVVCLGKALWKPIRPERHTTKLWGLTSWCCKLCGVLLSSFISSVAEAYVYCHVNICKMAATDELMTHRSAELIRYLDQDKIRKLQHNFVKNKQDHANFVFLWQVMVTIHSCNTQELIVMASGISTYPD